MALAVAAWASGGGRGLEEREEGNWQWGFPAAAGLLDGLPAGGRWGKAGLRVGGMAAMGGLPCEGVRLAGGDGREIDRRERVFFLFCFFKSFLLGPICKW